MLLSISSHTCYQLQMSGFFYLEALCAICILPFFHKEVSCIHFPSLMFSLIMLLSCVLLAFVCILNGNSHRCRALFHNLVQVSCLTSCLSIRAGHTHIWKMYPAIPCVTSLTAISSNSCANLLYICHKAMCIANCKYNLNSVSCLGVWVPQDN